MLYSMSNMDALLDLGDCFTWIQPLGAHLGTVHDLMTPVQLVRIIYLLQALLGEVIPGINDPPTGRRLASRMQ